MKAQVHNHHGAPTLFLDDKAVFANIHLLGSVFPAGLPATQASLIAFVFYRPR